MSNIYVGLFFLDSSYSRGIDSTIDYFNSIAPGNTVVISTYIVDGDPQTTSDRLTEFLATFPPGSPAATISQKTSVISVLSADLHNLGLDIPCFSISATATLMKTLPNSLTYAPFDQYSVMNNYMIYKEYQMKHLKILYQPNSSDEAFFSSYIELMQTQGGLLGINVEVDTIEYNKTAYYLQQDTAIILLFTDYSLINSIFLSQIPKGCYISMTDINNNVSNIFGTIPAFVILPFPVDYTTTSQNVYDSLTDKTNFLYNIYGFFDILYTIYFFTTNPSLPFTLQNYVDVNAFTAIPSAFGYSSWNLDINGSDYGLYDIIFTKDTIIGSETALFNTYNDGGIARLPQSQSIFMSMGIAPFFSSKIFICRQNYIKIYNQNKVLIVVRFEKNTTKYNNQQIIVAETLPCNFSISYNQDGFFSVLQPIFSICNTKLVVNATMSKQITYEIMFENGIYNQQTVDELKASLCSSSPKPSPPLPLPPPVNVGTGIYLSNPNYQNARICKSICGAVNNCEKYQLYMLGL
jgi:hypothetical protein